jgi:Kyakuja-Dileera-Zisupton transposase
VTDQGVHGWQETILCVCPLVALFKELPEWWTVGILYDIMCQIHQSLLKWNFMPEWHSCIIFGVSVFHVYGHQWMCQLWYHPQKSEIWGKVLHGVSKPVGFDPVGEIPVGWE